VSSIVRSFVAVAITAAALYGLQHTTPGYGEITSPIAVAGKLGKRVAASAFTIGVAKVHLARTVTTKSVGRTQTFTSSGVWVLVEGAAEARSESLTLMSAQWLGPNGVRYALSQRFSTVPGILPSERLEPGLPRPVLMAFEIPEGEVSGGTLLIARTALTPLEEEVRIEMTHVRPDNIGPALVLARSEGPVPWTLRSE
jgi:hypothetical protein